jgi:hypothetical protein
MRVICIDAKGSSLCEGEFYEIEEPTAGFAGAVSVTHDGVSMGLFLKDRFKPVDEAPKPGRTTACCGGLIPPGQPCAYHGS